MKQRALIKVCGITSESAAEEIGRGEADAIGFVFDPDSRRRVTPKRAFELAKHVPSRVKRVGVFVDTSRDSILRIAEASKLDWVQIHGRSDGWRASEVCDWPVKVRCIGIGTNGNVSEGQENLEIANWILFDTKVSGKAGGTGMSFDWQYVHKLRAEIAGELPIMLAGGLNASNVSKALNIAEPDGVDVSSGVEVNGEKDAQRIRSFIDAVRAREVVHHA